MSLLFCTDLHTNFLRQKDGAFRFVKNLVINNPKADGLIITGDISSGEVLEDHLTQIAQGFSGHIYMVTGNHDYYNSSFKDIDNLIPKLTDKFSNLHWLNQGWVSYKGISIVGVGGWYDAYYGNSNTQVRISDFNLIEELKHAHLDLIIKLVRSRAKREADRLDELLADEILVDNRDVVLVATHIPPYPEASWHEGKVSDRDWLPWFSSASTGLVLDKYSSEYPNKKFVVLTGHGHSPGIYKRSSNLVIYTGGAKYYSPELAGIIDVVGGKISTYNSFAEKVEMNFP